MLKSLSRVNFSSAFFVPRAGSTTSFIKHYIMAYSEFLVDRVRQRLGHAGITEEKKMMGGLILMVNHKMCIGVDIDKRTNTDRLMVRVGKLPYEELLNVKGSRTMDFTGTVMRGFLFIDPDGFDTEEDLDFWTEKAIEFNRML
ncbi:MAG: hypothetical protein ACJAVN_002029 [Roseivirga sp.]|jgi:hypothetical protein